MIQRSDVEGFALEPIAKHLCGNLNGDFGIEASVASPTLHSFRLPRWAQGSRKAPDESSVKGHCVLNNFTLAHSLRSWLRATRTGQFPEPEIRFQ